MRPFLLFFFLSNTVRRRISESQLSKVAYHPAMKMRDVIDESLLIVHNIE